jgi:hypothetical protein
MCISGFSPPWLTSFATPATPISSSEVSTSFTDGQCAARAGTSYTRVLYQIHANERQPQRMEQLRAACDAINKRRLHRDKRLLKFEVIDPPPGGS